MVFVFRRMITSLVAISAHIEDVNNDVTAYASDLRMIAIYTRWALVGIRARDMIILLFFRRKDYFPTASFYCKDIIFATTSFYPWLIFLLLQFVSLMCIISVWFLSIAQLLPVFSLHFMSFAVWVGLWVCGESWLAVKDSLTHRPSSQGWASGVLLYMFVSSLFCAVVLCARGVSVSCLCSVRGFRVWGVFFLCFFL